MNEKRYPKKDIIVLVIAFIAILAVWFIMMQMHRTPGASAIVTINGVEYGNWPLDEDGIYPIEQDGSIINTLEIKDGYADMTEATCPDFLCVRQTKIHASGETIVCLPHKLVVTISNGEEASYDAIAK